MNDLSLLKADPLLLKNSQRQNSNIVSVNGEGDFDRHN